MKIFASWAFVGGLAVMFSYYVSTLGSRFFTYDSFTFVFMVWMVFAIFALEDLIKCVLGRNDDE